MTYRSPAAGPTEQTPVPISSLTRLVIVFVAVVAFALPTGLAAAQTDATPLRPAAVEVAPRPVAPAAGAATDARWGPAFGINRVRLTGEAKAGRVRLEATVTVAVNREDEWVRVPLGFQEAILAGWSEQSPDGSESAIAPAGRATFDAFTKDTGYAWWLFGPGEHVMTLSLWVKPTGPAGSPRLSLTLPPNAATASAEIGLDTVSTVTAGEGLLLETDPADGDNAPSGNGEPAGDPVEGESPPPATQIFWVGSGAKLDLSWQPVPTAAGPADLAAVTTAIVRVIGKTVQLEASQRIEVVTGVISSLDVRVPTGFTVADLRGRMVRGHTVREAGGGRFATVTLTEPTAGPFDLTWRFEAPVPAGDATLSIDGPEIVGTPPERQSGTVGVEQSNAWRITASPATRGVQPRDMAGPAVTVGVIAAYEFAAQPFLVDLKFESIPPAFTSAPEYRLEVRPDLLELDARFRLRVTRGEVSNVQVRWPGATEWVVPPIRAAGLTEVERRPATATEPLAIDVGVAVARPPDLPLRASRPLDPNGGTIRLNLPRVETPDQEAAVLGITHPDGLTVEVAAVGGGMLQPLAAAEARPLGFEAPPAGSRRTLWIVPATVKAIDLSARRLSREVSTTTLATVRAHGEGLWIEQRIDYDIHHEPLTAARLMLPEELLGQARFTDEAGRPIVPRRTELRTGGRVQLELPLGGGVIGRTGVTVQYPLSLPASSDAVTVPLPLVTASEADFGSVRLRVGPIPGRAAVVADDGWARLHATEADGLDRWTAADPGGSIPLRFIPAAPATGRHPIATRVLIRSVVERDGVTRSIADVRFHDAPAMLLLRFAPGVKPERFIWRDRAVAAAVLRSGPEGTLVELPLAGPNTAAPVLRLSMRNTAAQLPYRPTTHRTLGLFTFPADVTVEQTLWRVTLPESRHLFATPDDYVPRFRWTLTGGLWGRQTEENFRELRLWFGGDLAAVSAPEFDSGHQYTFTRFGSPEPLRIVTIARSVVVLIGAGLSIGLGFLLVNGLFPLRRVALPVLLIVLLAGWAFYPQQMMIFLQPAVFGVALVLVAAVADWLLRRRQTAAGGFDAASHVDFVTILPGDPSGTVVPAGVGSEEPTVLRQSRSGEAVSGHTPR